MSNPQEPVSWRKWFELFLMVIVFFIGAGYLHHTHQARLEENLQRSTFEAEFGRSPDEPGLRETELAIQVRLEALCSVFRAAVDRAIEKKITITPGTIPGTEGERLVWLAEAEERVANEEGGIAGKRFWNAYNIAFDAAEKSDLEFPGITNCGGLK